MSTWTQLPYWFIKLKIYSLYKKRLVLYKRLSETFQLFLYYLMQAFAVQEALCSQAWGPGFPAAIYETASKRLCAVKFYRIIVIPLYHIKITHHISFVPPIASAESCNHSWRNNALPVGFAIWHPRHYILREWRRNSFFIVKINAIALWHSSVLC